MPKENVSCVAGGLRAEVGWTAGTEDRDGYVQLATTNPDSPFRMPRDDESPAQLVARLQLELADAMEYAATAVKSATGNTPPVATGNASRVTEVKRAEPFDGWHVTLDRDRINRLIRVLRVARDKAFGPDA